MKTVSHVLLAALVLGLAACQSGGLDKKSVAELSALRYPETAPRTEDLDIVVRATGGTLKLTNRTPTAYHNVDLWLNEQYVTRVKEIKIAGGGRGMSLPLSRFINRHGESFPVGGFLTPDKSFPVVHAELYDPATGACHRLLVRR
jgi:hypothetical protein